MQLQTRVIKVIIILPLLAGLLLGIQHFYLTQRYSAKITVEFTPASSTATLDGKKIGAGTLRVRPGSKTIRVTHPGFSEASQVYSLRKHETTYVGVVLESNSPSTTNWYSTHPADQKLVEKIAGLNMESVARKALILEPFIKELPFVGPGGIFRVDYGQTDSATGKPKIIIQADSKEAADDALSWIRTKGYKPESMKITYQKFSVENSNAIFD
ncbi:MAG: PEGA domain-containing protein [Candidatus Saccharimonadales bacterium]